MILTQNALIVSGNELDALETDTYSDRSEVTLCGSSFCRSKTSVLKLKTNSLTPKEKATFLTIEQEQKELKSAPLSSADMPQFNHFERLTPLKVCGRERKSMSQRTKTKIRQKLTAWANTQRPKHQQLKFVFITLTLTSKQIGTDKDYSRMLNTFFTYLRKYYGFKNYFYVNEKQENGNLHSHIVYDRFLPAQRINYIWCKILQQNGYTFNGQKEFKAGKGGANPVDVTQIFSTDRVGSYVTKYVTKNHTEMDCAIWNCSNTISRLFTSVKFHKKDVFYTLFHTFRNTFNVKLANRETLHINLLSFYHGIQKKHFKINERVLCETIDREQFIKENKDKCKLNQLQLA
ncbi:hypothetical protein CKK33_11505 [Mucilaginibacter sp. MD40]|uniref:rolling circle replication-associated protein n=1 Tax=Mucilaginibacter sp. MD40 TaxID=2029590 RepID=UPI000BACBFE2|nr:hypothetical protein [Mucilaginibacter sp. MD40]PAW94087.1 hypothetical protein CKK33_11505 [Mucilaginibacter sp. MD40]